VPAILYVVARRPAGVYVPVLWLSVMVLLLEFFPKELHPLTVSPRMMRYADAWVVPTSLIVAAALDAVRRWHRGAFWACIVLLATSGLVEARTLHRVWVEPLSDRNDAAGFLASLPVKPVYSDFWLTARYAFIMQYGPALPIPSEVHGKQLQMGVTVDDPQGVRRHRRLSRRRDRHVLGLEPEGQHPSAIVAAPQGNRPTTRGAAPRTAAHLGSYPRARRRGRAMTRGACAEVVIRDRDRLMGIW